MDNCVINIVYTWSLIDTDFIFLCSKYLNTLKSRAHVISCHKLSSNDLYGSQSIFMYLRHPFRQEIIVNICAIFYAIL